MTSDLLLAESAWLTLVFATTKSVGSVVWKRHEVLSTLPDSSLAEVFINQTLTHVYQMGNVHWSNTDTRLPNGQCSLIKHWHTLAEWAECSSIKHRHTLAKWAEYSSIKHWHTFAEWAECSLIKHWHSLAEWAECSLIKHWHSLAEWAEFCSSDFVPLLTCSIIGEVNFTFHWHR